MRCPVCKAENNQGSQCRRCKADLVLLFTLQAQRERALVEARRCLAEGQWRCAVEHAEEASRIRKGDDVRRLVAVAHLLERDFVAAWRAYGDRKDRSTV